MRSVKLDTARNAKCNLIRQHRTAFEWSLIMEEKPISGDDEQRRNDNRASREQSGLPPEDEGGEGSESAEKRPSQREPERPGSAQPSSPS